MESPGLFSWRGGRAAREKGQAAMLQPHAQGCFILDEGLGRGGSFKAKRARSLERVSCPFLPFLPFLFFKRLPKHGPTGIARDFEIAPATEGVKLDPEQRRHVYLILKEALNNVARHSGCAAVALSFRVEGNRLKAEIHDDGRGFDVNAPSAARPSNRGGLQKSSFVVPASAGRLGPRSFRLKPGLRTKTARDFRKRFNAGRRDSPQCKRAAEEVSVASVR
jgi:hypothetical protein